MCSKIREMQGKGVMPDGTIQFFDFVGTPTFAGYTVVAVTSLVEVNEAASLEKVSILICVVPTSYDVAFNITKVICEIATQLETRL